MSGRWKLNRAGIVNVYQYGDEVLEFGGGRLLLRGVNGSGKSTAMNMLLPFLIDADARRIDAAGVQSGVIKSWMLSGRDEAQPVGYLWIEFERRDPDAGSDADPEHFVCGCGIRANQSTERVTTWWFVTDRRPHVDLSLVESRVPLSPDALRAEIGPHAVFAEDQRAAYRQTVRDRLFGGRDLDQHVRLLHVVRSPRVGDRVDVDLPEYLRDALPQLSDAALDDAAQPLEDLEEHRRNVSGLTRTVENLRALTDVYRSYLATDLRRRADDLAARSDHVDQAQRTSSRLRRVATTAAAAVAGAEATVHDLATRARVLADEIATLKESPAYVQGAELNDLREHVRSLGEAVSRAEASLSAAAGRRDRAARAVATAAAVTGQEQQRLVAALADLADDSDRVRLAARPPAVPTVAADEPGAAIDTPIPALDTTAAESAVGAVLAAARVRHDEVRDVGDAFASVDGRRGELERAERDREAAGREVERAHERVAKRRGELGETLNSWRLALEEWHADAARVDAEVAERIDRSDAAVAELLDERRAVRTRWEEAVGDLAGTRMSERAAVAALRVAAADEHARWQQEVDDLRERRGPDPPASAWQRSGRRTTFAEVVDFAAGVSYPDRLGLEAALEASGLLGAELEPAGDALRLESGELVTVAAQPVAAPLSGHLVVSVPDDRAPDVDAAAIGRLLDSISTDLHGAAATAVGVDGAFRLGALLGRHHKDVAEHIGATARRAAIARRLAAAEAELAAAAERLAAGDTELARLDALIGALHGQRRALPGTRPVDVAEARALAADEQLAVAEERVEEAAATVAAADEAHAAAVEGLSRLAATLQLPTDRAELQRVGEVVQRVAHGCHTVLGHLRTLATHHGAWLARLDDWRDSADAYASAENQLAERIAEREPVAMRLATLEDSIGLEYEQIVKTIEVSAADLAHTTARLEQARDAKEAALIARRDAERDAADAEATWEQARTDCVDAIAPLQRALATPGVAEALAPATGEAAAGDAGTDDDVALAWTPPVVELSPAGARSLATALGDALDALATDAVTADGIRQSVRQRRDQLGAGWDAEDSQPDESLPIVISVNGPLGRLPLAAAARESARQLSQQSSLLTAKQDQALRNLLQGLVAKEVADKLHAAGELVELMNRRLENVRTAHGIGASLTWRRRGELGEDTAEMITLLGRPPDLRTADHEAQLTAALSKRIAQARRDDPERRYRELIAEMLDYRDWHEMGVVVHRKGRNPERLTRRTPLSEGEKKIVSYLPLFAAVAASCDAIGEYEPAAPRFVLLDDAFAKVSEDNHAQLFGLLVAFDLDFIATSERLWGTHDTVPELAITEVLRDASLGVILLEHSRWDGRQLGLR